MTALSLIPLSFLLAVTACSPANSSASEPTETSAIPAEQKTIAPLPDSLPRYAWLTGTYDPEQSLARQVDVPQGYQRINTSAGSFAEWLRYLPLFPAGHAVHLYDGSRKGYQGAHAAVIEMDVGTRDLQQCADAIMRLKSEYHYSREEWDGIHFNFSDGTPARFSDWMRGNRLFLRNDRWVLGQNNGTAGQDRANFGKYLRLVFGYAGTATLSRELEQTDPARIRAGELFIQGGHPGHAILVLDVAENENGEQIFLLGQSYMPAQEFHLLRNPNDPALSPWYRLEPEGRLATPEWTFRYRDRRRFGE